MGVSQGSVGIDTEIALLTSFVATINALYIEALSVNSYTRTPLSV